VKSLLLIVTIPLSLASCAPFQIAGTSKNGNPYVVQSGGVLHKMKGGVLKATNGTIVLEQILEEPDGTEVVKQISSDRLSLGLARVWSGRDKHTSDNDTTVELGEQGVQKNKDTLDATVKMQENSLSSEE
jgi:hypothetical protein